jgi:hypothetical protein
LVSCRSERNTDYGRAPGTGLYFTQVHSWNSSTRNLNTQRSGLPLLPIPPEQVTSERAADALATLVRSGVTFETRRIAAYSFWSYLHNSQGEEEAKRTLCIVFEQKYPNRDLNLALSEFDALLQTTIAPRDSCCRRSRPESKSTTVGEDYRCLGIGFFL